MNGICLTEGFLLFVAVAPDSQDHRFLEAGYVDGKGLVKRIWTFVIGIFSTDDSAFSELDGLFGPLRIRAAAGG